MTAPGGTSTGFPEPIALVRDHSTRCSDGARTVLGGSPFRLLRFTDGGAEAVQRVLSGVPVGAHRGASGADRTVARLLLDAGMAHPTGLEPPALSVSIVVPVHQDAAGLDALLASLASSDPGDQGSGAGVVEVRVIDDASPVPVQPAHQVPIGTGRPVPVAVVRLEQNRGPGGARNAGWWDSGADIVVFLDADVRVEPGWLGGLLAHFADPLVGAVAPRVRSEPGPTARERYERTRSPLDLGPEPARVHPGSRVSYVPSAALAVRRSVLRSLDGFDPTMRVGEDVDLVWRAIAAGHRVRYEPGVVVTHRVRPDVAAIVRQRHGYGRAAAALDRRHPWQVAPVVADPWSLAAWSSAAVAGRPGVAAGLASTAYATAVLARRLDGRVPDPWREAARLVGGGTLALAPQVSRAVTRTWAPVVVAAGATPGAFGRRARRFGLVAVLVGPGLDWLGSRPRLDPLRWVGLSLADDLAYASGVWRGALSQRSGRALLPRSSRVPGIGRPPAPSADHR